jgi:hypothetical protein
MFKWLFFTVIILAGVSAWASPWEDHLGDIEYLETQIYKSQQELDVLVEKKKNTREQARIEQTLNRIVEIHAELISLRGRMDNVREHLKDEHPEKAHVLDRYDSRVYGRRSRQRSYNSPLATKLDELILKVQLKFATFLRPEQDKREVLAVEEEISKKRKEKKEREADVYLRKRSKVRLVE